MASLEFDLPLPLLVGMVTKAMTWFSKGGGDCYVAPGVEARAWRLRHMKRRQTWEAFVCGWASEFLNYVPEVILVDIVDWWLMLCLLLLNLWLWFSGNGIKVLIWGLSLIVIKKGFFFWWVWRSCEKACWGVC